MTSRWMTTLAVAAAFASALPLGTQAAWSAASGGSPAVAGRGRRAVADRHTLPRTIVTTDSEADDINSFIRLLYYANELDIEGLIYTSSVHHWKGDGVHTLRQAQQAGLVTSYKGETAGSAARSDDALAWRWEPLGWMEDKLLHEYSKVYPNLLQHDANYPSPAELWSKVAVGNVAWENDFGADTEGSNRIKAALLDDDPRPLYLEAWGGTNTIARALISIENQYRSTANWAEVRDKVIRKARIATIGQQDNAYRDYISRSWPAIVVLDFDGVFGGFSSYTRSQVPPEILPYYTAEYWATHIKYGHGPLLDGYGLVGDGTYFEGEGRNPGWQPGQAKDMATFKLFNVVGGFARLDWTGEGDTPSFISLVPTGLRFLEDPSLGGWGGRLQKSSIGDASYTRAMDYNPKLQKPTAPYTVTRWMPAIGNDFAARADWGVTARYEDANHAPRIEVLGRSDVVARAGGTVPLTVRGDDPDGDRLSASWWIYADASSVTGTAAVKGAGKSREFRGTVSVPATAQAGQRIVVVAAVTDAGSPPLTRYAQFVITIDR